LKLSAARLIELLRLEPLPIEGGHFRQTWRSDAGTAIYYLLSDDPDSFSAMHRLPTDEVYHFYLGDAVEMLLLHPDGLVQNLTLGPDVLHGQHVQYVVPHGVWQGSRLQNGGRYALLGTTMAPGFDPKGYEGGSRERLIAEYPAAAAALERLTR
jgi:predicted cupin superfamily sugar epimerase